MAVTPKPIPTRAHMGERLEALLLERGWTQAELGRRLKARGQDWSRQSVSIKFSSGRWDADTIWTLANVLDVPIEAFFCETITLPSRSIKRA